jgi:hypothetical protein
MFDDWKNMLEEEMEREADLIMEEVNSDPSLRDVEAPPGMYEELMEQINEYERQRAYERLSDEDKEYMRLGKEYAKRRKNNQILVLAVAVVAAFMVGTVSIGENQNIFGFISRLFADGDQVIVNSDDIEPVLYVDENELYEDIEKEYGFVPIKLGYLPQDAVFYEATFSKDIQTINIIYETSDKTSLLYVIRPNYRDASLGTVVEDEKIQEYQMTVRDINVVVTEYQILESEEQKWTVHFEYEDVTYMIRIVGMKQEDVERIVMNLLFKQ